MKRCLAIVAILIAVITVNRSADACSGARKGESEILSLLSGKRIVATAPGGEEWREDHCSSGDLYKVGAGTTADPYAKKGTWSVVPVGADAVVKYDYDGGPSYQWSLWDDPAGLCWGDPAAADDTIATGPVPSDSASPCAPPSP